MTLLKNRIPHHGHWDKHRNKQDGFLKKQVVQQRNAIARLVFWERIVPKVVEVLNFDDF